MATFLLVLGFALWMVTRSWFIVWQVEPALQAKLGGNVTIQSAQYLGNGWVGFDDVVLTVPETRGPAAEVLRIDRARVEVSLTSLLRLKPLIRDVEFENVHMRLSESDTSPGALNVLLLDPDFGDDGDGKTAPPNVRLRNAVLEVGRHAADGAYEQRGRLHVEGVLTAYANDRDRFSFKLREIDEAGDIVESGLSITGEWDTRNNAHQATLRGFALDDDTFDMLPQLAQVWWERMALEGRVAEMTLHYEPGAGSPTAKHRGWGPLPYDVQFDIRDVAITLPVDVEGVWSRYEGGDARPVESLPRMWVESGRIRASTQRLEFIDLIGYFGSSDADAGVLRVPYRVALTLTAPSPLDLENPEAWAEEVLAACAVKMTATVEDFTVAAASVPSPGGGQENEPPAPPSIDLPHAVARVMERFALEEWTLSAEITVERDEPTRDESGALIVPPLRTYGTARITDAAGAYFKFPYPLERVDADLTFDESEVIVESLTATGAGGSPIEIKGRIAPPTTRHPSVELTITARNALVDETLRAALQDEQGDVFAALMPADAYESLRDGGILIDDEAIEQFRVELAQRRAERARLDRPAGASPDADVPELTAEQLDLRIAQLERLIDVGPFQLGGTVDLDLTITRELGPGLPTETAGVITVRKVGLLYENFPYPFTVTSGQLDWRDDRVRVVEDEHYDGLTAVTHGGGVAKLRGEIGFEKISDDERQLEIALDIAVEHDAFTPAVAAAIPGRKHDDGRQPAALAEPSDWRPGLQFSPGGRIVRALTPGGLVDYTGRIRRTEEDGTSFRFDLNVAGAHIAPTSDFAPAVGTDGVLWPDGYVVRDLDGHIVVTQDAVTIESLAGAARNGDIELAGLISYGERRDISIDAAFRGLPIGEHLLDLVPQPKRDGAIALWNQFLPRGTFDAWLDFHDDRSGATHETDRAGGQSRTRLSVRPSQMQITLNDEPVNLLGISGDVEISSAQEIELNDIEVHLNAGGRDDGQLRLAGRILPLDEVIYDVTGDWKQGQFESPLIREVLHRSGAHQLLRDYLELRITGLFDADFAYRTDPPPDRKRFRIGLEPATVALTRQGRVAAATLDEGSRIIFEPQLATIERISGRHSGGTFSLSGVVRSAHGVEADLTVDYLGRLLAEPMRAFVPLAVQRGLDAIKLREGAPTEIIGAKLTLREMVDLDLQRAWASTFDGRARLNDASILVGMNLSEISGAMPVCAEYVPGYSASLHIDVNLDLARAKGRLVTDVNGTIDLNEDATALLVRDVHGVMHGGTVAVAATQQLQGDFAYEVECGITGVALNAFMADTLHDPIWSELPDDEAPDPEEEARSNQPAGLIYGQLTLSGLRDRPESRRGVGTVRMMGGKLVAVPLALQLVQLLQLTLPTGGGFDFANVQFFVDGTTAVLERIVFEATSNRTAMLSLEGSGTLDLETMHIRARFNSRGGVAVLRDILAELGDQMIAIEVTGPLREPRARVIALPGVSSADDR